MGCGGSKFDPEGGSVPARIRPLLRRRLEEMRRRRNGGSSLKQSSATDDLSKKELLKDGVSTDDDNSSHQPNQDSDNKSIASVEDSLKLPNTTPLEAATKPESDVEAAKETPAPLLTKSPKVTPEPEPEKLLKKTSFKSENKGEEKKKGDDNEEIIEGGKITDDSMFPGSPSFRVYFIESLMNFEDDGDEDDDDKEDDSDKKSQSEDSRAAMESISSNEDLGSKKKKKTRRAHRLRKVIPMGRPAGAVKHLLNVKSCYNPACGGRGHGHDKASLLTDKPAS